MHMKMFSHKKRKEKENAKACLENFSKWELTEEKI